MVQVWTGLTRTSLIIGSIGTIQQSYPVVISSPGSGPDPKPHPQSVGVHSAVNGPPNGQMERPSNLKHSTKTCIFTSP